MWGQTKEDINNKLKAVQRGYAKIDLDAVENNMNQMHSHLMPGTKMLGVIKTNAYGHGAAQVGKILEQLDYVYGYAVASVEEAKYLKSGGLNKPIIILGYAFPYCYEELALNDIRPAVFRDDEVEQLCEAAKKTGKTIKVHIKVDTGMGRIGIRPDDSGLLFVKNVLSRKELELEGVFTHFSKADETDKTAVNKQISIFSEFCSRIENELGVNIPLKHCSNSAGIIELSDANMDMVRAGITMYGLMPSDEVDVGEVNLRPALSIYSHISFIKTVRCGESVSYGGLFTATKDTLVATVPVGYGDGYPRMLSGKGSVLIRGKRCNILGRVCMDQFMVDVSDIPDIKEGEEVILLGGNNSIASKESFESAPDRITAEEIGKISGRFNYELVCLISDRIPRVYYYKGEPVFVKDAAWR